MSILLIYPPITYPRFPQLGIPTLLSYLRPRGIDVTAIDANLEFFQTFLTEKRINEGREYIEERIDELNRKHVLERHEKEEFLELVSLIHSCGGKQILTGDEIFTSQKSMNTQAKQDAFRTAALFSSIPFFPERIIIKIKSLLISYLSSFNNFSSTDILRSLQHGGILSGFFEVLLPPLLSRQKPRIVGISISTEGQILAAFRCAAVVKRIRPNIHVTIGGSFVSSTMSRLNNKRFFEVIDSMVLGDGEIPLERLATELYATTPDLTTVPGLVYHDGESIRKNMPAPVMDLESLSPPDYSTFDLDRYLMPRSSMYLPFRSSRGCYWKRCVFCRTDSPLICTYQQATADHSFEMLRSIGEQTGITSFAFSDEAPRPAEMEKLAATLMRENVRIHWSTNFRFEKSITMDRCMTLRKGGCTNISFGIESYNDRLLELIDKGTTVDTIKTILSNISWSGVYVWTYMMVGLPSETENEARQGYIAIKKLMNEGFIGNYLYNSFQLFPDSITFKERERFGITGIQVPEGQDLEGPLLQFETPGMSRVTAEKLCTIFNFDTIPEPIQEIMSRGRAITLQHDTQQLLFETYLSLKER